MNFGEKVKYVRSLRQLSLEELAVKCELSKTYLSEIENNKKRPSTKSLERLAKALAADSWFFMDDNATTFEELLKVSKYDPPDEIMNFLSNPESLPYVVLAKKLKDGDISLDYIEDLLKTMMKYKTK